MENNLEEKRQKQMAARQGRMSAQDEYRIRVEQKETEAIQGRTRKTEEKDVKTKGKEETGRWEDLATVDEYARLKMDSHYKRLAEFLDIKDADFNDSKDALTIVMEWAKDNIKGDDMLDVLGFIKKVRSSWGFKEVGVTGLKKIYMYARLDMDQKRIEREKKLLKD